MLFWHHSLSRFPSQRKSLNLMRRDDGEIENLRYCSCGPNNNAISMPYRDCHNFCVVEEEEEEEEGEPFQTLSWIKCPPLAKTSSVEERGFCN